MATRVLAARDTLPRLRRGCVTPAQASLNCEFL